MTTETTERDGLMARIGAQLSMSVLVPLVIVDLFFIAASVWHLTLGDRTGPWVLETDGGFPEQFGYLQQGAIALLLLALALVTRRGVFVAWGTLYAFALADDSLRLHENKGAWLADRIGEHFWFPDGLLGLRANDLGEILVWGLLAVFPLVAVALLHRRGDPVTRRDSLGIGVLLALYIFCGGVIDQLHVLVMNTPIGDTVGTLEDGGEMIALSLTVAFATGLLAAARRRQPSGAVETAPTGRHRRRIARGVLTVGQERPDVDVRVVDLYADGAVVLRAEATLSPDELARARRGAPGGAPTAGSPAGGTADRARRRAGHRRRSRSRWPRRRPVGRTCFRGRGDASVDVSCSASGAVGVVVVSRERRVGVDVQQIEPWRPRRARRGLADRRRAGAVCSSCPTRSGHWRSRVPGPRRKRSSRPAGPA